MMFPAPASALSAVRSAIPRTGVDLSRSRVARRRAGGGSRRRRWVVYGSPGRPMMFSVETQGRRRPRDAAAAHARARDELVALGEDTSQVTASVRLDVEQGARATDRVGAAGWPAVNQVPAPPYRTGRSKPCTLTVIFLEPVPPRHPFVVSAETRTPREGTIAVPLFAFRSAERETGGGVAVDVVGPGEIGERQPSRTGTGRRARPRRHRVRPRISVDGRVPVQALPGTSPRDAPSDVSRYTPQAVLVANVEEARYDALVGEDGQDAGAGALCGAQQPAQLPGGRRCRRSHAVERGARRTSDASRILGGPAVCCCRLQKGRTGEEAPVFIVELVYLQRLTPGPTRAKRVSSCLPSISLWPARD